MQYQIAALLWLGHGASSVLGVAAIATLPVRSRLIDGEAIVSDDSGLAVFALLRSFRHDDDGVLCAFDLLETDGEDLRKLPLEIRKAGLAQLLRSLHLGIALNTHHVGHGKVGVEVVNKGDKRCGTGVSPVSLTLSQE